MRNTTARTPTAAPAQNPWLSSGRRPGLLVALAGLVVLAVVIGIVGVAKREPTVTLRPTPGDLDRTVDATTSSLYDFWGRQLPATYHRGFTKLRGGFQPKTPESKPWTCNGQREQYSDIKGNAFYCGGPGDDYIAYDAAFLFPRLDSTFGSVAPAIVLAHEMGHAVQHRAGVQAESIVIELQADCFAGSWVHWAQASSTDPVDVANGALDTSVEAILTLRDRPGTPAAAPRAHGLGFDRVNAFETGYEQGANACAALTGIVTTELPFSTVSEAVTGGNAPYDVAVPLFAGSLDTYWQQHLSVLRAQAAFRPPQRRPVPAPPLPSCPQAGAYDARSAVGYCPPTNTAAWADTVLLQAHERIGDFATGTAFSEVWGRAAQTQAALPVAGQQAGLQRDCFTGAWVAEIASGGAGDFKLSPGDIDEVLITVLADSFTARRTRPDRGDAFERTQALRRGMFDGLTACR